MKKDFRVLVINPGSTSTKLALYSGETELWSDVQRYEASMLKQFHSIIEQEDFRAGEIDRAMAAHSCDYMDIDGVVGRGGLLRPINGGTYAVSQTMMDDLHAAKYGEHASNLGAILAHKAAVRAGNKPAFIVDPVVVDEMNDEARLSGMPLITRRSIFHALNQKAAARSAADEMGKHYEELNLIVVHLGGGISVGAHKHGRVVDVNNALDGDGPIAPERSGSLPAGELVKLCFSGKYSLAEMKKKLVGGGGMAAHLGINDMRELRKRIDAGDESAAKVFDAMVYTVSKEIGMRAIALKGKVDAIVITGGIANDRDFVNGIAEMVSWIAPLKVYPGEFEMEALRDGGLRVLSGEEHASVY